MFYFPMCHRQLFLILAMVFYRHGSSDHEQEKYYSKMDSVPVTNGGSNIKECTSNSNKNCQTIPSQEFSNPEIIDCGFHPIDVDGKVLIYSAYADYREPGMLRIVSEGKGCCMHNVVQCRFWFWKNDEQKEILTFKKALTRARYFSENNTPKEQERYFSTCL